MTDDPNGRRQSRSKSPRCARRLLRGRRAERRRLRTAKPCSTAIPSSPPSSPTSSPSKMKSITWRYRSARWFQTAGTAAIRPTWIRRNCSSAWRARPPVATNETLRFGDYELQGEIARGGMGVVYREPAAQPEPPGRPQSDPRRCSGDRRRRAAVSQRGRGGRPPRPSPYRADLRGRRSTRLQLLQHEAHRGREPGGTAQGISRRPQSGGPVDGDDLPGRPPCPRARHPAPRPETVQHPDRRPGPTAGGRLRAGPAGRRRQRAHPDRRRARHPFVHGPRTSHGPRGQR